MIKIAFSMIHYPVAMGRYILEALMRREDVEVWTTGPFSGQNIPWGGGMVLPPEYVLPPDMPLPMNVKISYDSIEDRMPFEPDLWIEANAGLEPIDRPKKGMYTVVGTDPHVLGKIYDNVRPRADKFFCMQKPYMKEGDVWLPYAYDPIYHTPTPKKWEERLIDCSLIGLHYLERVEFFKQLKAAGYVTHMSIGQAYYDAAKIYHNTKVGFNRASLQDTTARVFELMGFAILPLLNRVPDLMEIFTEDEHFLGFGTMGEAIEKFKWAMQNPFEAKKIAAAGHQAVQPHTWDARVEQILKECGFLDG